jgi:hypothetical protein
MSNNDTLTRGPAGSKVDGVAIPAGEALVL